MLSWRIHLNDKYWFSLLRVFVTIGLLAGMLMSHTLWWGDRLFPMIPVVDVSVPHWFHPPLTIAFVGALAAMIVSSHRVCVALVLALAAVLLFLDQLRWQPWIYLYMLILLPIALNITDKPIVARYYQILIAGIYFWSGLHKLNPHFLDGNYAVWIKYLFNHKFSSQAEPLRLIGYGVGVLEMTIGAGLLFRKTRAVMIWCSAIMHLSIVTFLIVQDDFGDSVVVPWNLVMIFINVLVFYPSLPAENSINLKHIHREGMHMFAILILWFCPALNFLGLWDHFLSFSLYANKVPSFYVAIEQDEIQKIDQRLINYCVKVPGMSGGQIIDVYWWAKDELNVPFYPQERTFRRLSKYFCELGIADGKVIFLEISHGSWKKNSVNSFACKRETEL